MRTSLPYRTALDPTEGFLGWSGYDFASIYSGPFSMMSLHALLFTMAVYLGAIGSMTSLLIAQILSHSIKFVFLEGP